MPGAGSGNTLWGGVIGDDGLSGIQIGELGTGHAFSDFQKWLKELKNRGILLTVCSKNNEDTAKEPFEKHPEMVLRLRTSPCLWQTGRIRPGISAPSSSP